VMNPAHDSLARHSELSRRLANRLLVARVDDLHPPIFARKRYSLILQLGLAIADRHQIADVDAIFFRDEPLDRVSAAFGQPLIVRLAALGVGMPRENESAALQVGTRQRLAESGDL